MGRKCGEEEVKRREGKKNKGKREREGGEERPGCLKSQVISKNGLVNVTARFETEILVLSFLSFPFFFILWSVNILYNERWNFLRCVSNSKDRERVRVGGRCEAKNSVPFETKSFPSLKNIFDDIWRYLTRTLNEQKMKIETEILSFFLFFSFLFFFLSFSEYPV